MGLARSTANGAVTITTGFTNCLIGLRADIINPNVVYAVALGTNAVAKSNECALSPYCNVFTFYTTSYAGVLYPCADLTISTVDLGDATRKYRIVIHAWDTIQREGIRIEASGSAPLLGFFGANAVFQPTVTGSRGGNAALASFITALASLGLIIDNSTV